MSLTTITEDDINNGGDLVSAIIASAGGDRITDIDAGAVEGIGITGLTSTNGSWQYNTGSGWTTVGAVSDTNSLLLRATDSLRYVPDSTDAETAFITFSAWDQSTGTAGTKVDASSFGGTTAFSATVETAFITVTGINDAPVISDLNGDFLAAVNDGSPVTLDTALPLSVLDVDSPSNFDGGTIQVVGSSFDVLDLLGIDTSGSVSLSAGFTNGATVSVGGIAIGSLSGVSGSEASIALNSNATLSRVTSVLESLTFASTSTVFGSRTVDITLNDGDGTANGGVDSSTATMMVNLTSSSNGLVTATEDIAYIYTATDFDFTGVTGANLQSITATSLPGSGVLLLNSVAVTANQTISKTDIDAGLLTFEAAANENGLGYANFNFYVNEGRQSVTVLGGETNDYTINSTQLIDTDSVLTDQSNFGPSGTVTTAIQLGSQTSTIDAAYLAQGDILFDGFTIDAAYDAGELAFIDSWVNAGGILISTNDDIAYDPIANHYGLVIGGTANATWNIATDAHAIINGPFGSVGNVGDPIVAAGSIAYFDSASLAVGDLVLATDSVSGEPTIVLRQEGAGWILFSSDEGIFRSDMTGGGAVSTPNDILAANIFAWAAAQTPATSQTMEINVTAVNDAPVTDHGGTYSINEGDALNLDASATTDVDSATLTYNWDLDNDGSYDDLVTTSATSTVTWATLSGLGVNDDGSYTIGLRVDDSAGGVVDTSTTLAITNVAPALTATGNATAAAGASYTLNLAHVDPGSDTIASWTVNWGDGSIETFAGDPSSVTHSYAATSVGLTFDINVSAIDEDGQWFSADALIPLYTGSQVEQVDGESGSPVITFAPSSDGITGHANILRHPNGNYLVSGYNTGNVFEYAPDGTLIGTFIGSGDVELSNAGGMAFGADGNLYIASSGDNEVLRYDVSGNFIDEFVSGGTGGLSQPLGLTFDDAGNLYVTSRGATGILKFDASGIQDTGFTTPQVSGAEDITIGPDGNLYVADLAIGVKRFNAATGAYIDTFVATGGGLASAAGIEFGPDGNLYVADQDGDAIRRYDGATGAFIDDYVTGIDGPAYLDFEADHYVTVVSTNQAPTIATNTGATVDEASTANVITTAMLNEGDPDDSGAGLTYTISADVTNGTLSLTGSTIGLNDTFTQADIDAGLVTYDHNGTETTADSFNFSLADGGENGATPAIGTFNFTVAPVNDAPTNGIPATQSVAEDGTIVFSTANGNTLSVNDVDSGTNDIRLTFTATNGTFTLAGTAGLTSVTTNGARSVTIEGPNSAIFAALNGSSFTPDANFNGTATLTMDSDDLGSTGSGGAKTDSDVMTITVNAMNDDPYDANAGSFPSDITVTEDVLSNVDLSPISIQDVDDAGNNLTVTLTTATGGNLTATSGGGVTVVGSGTGAITLTGSQGSLNTFLDTASNIQYLHATSNLNGNDADTINVVVNDNGNMGSGGGTDIDLGTVNVDITTVNNAPVNTVPGAQSVDEDTPLTIAGISVNDVDGDLTSTQLTVASGILSVNLAGGATIGAGANGSSTLTLSGSQTQINAALATLSYQGNLDFNGVDSLTVLSTDSAGVPLSDTDNVAITINPINDLSIVLIDPADLNFTEQSPIGIDINASLSDVDSTTLAGATIRISANYESGVDQLQFTNQNGITGSYNNGTGVLTLSGTASVANYQVAIRSLVFDNQSDNPATGTRTIEWVVTDGTDSSVAATRDIIINATLDAPVIGNNALTITEGATVVITSLQLSATDAETPSGALVFTVSGLSGGQFEEIANPGSSVLSFTQQQIVDGEIQFVHDGNEAAPIYLITVTDGGLADGPNLAAITYTNVNDAPTGSVLIDNTTPAQGDLLTASNTLADADGLSGPIAYQWYSDGVLITGATSSTYTTLQADVGTAISVVASYTDDQGTAETSTSASTAAVTNVNDAVAGQPVILGTTTEDETLTADTSGINDADGLGTFNYQWYRDGVAISGATATTYTLGDADVGSTTTLVVSYTDNQGTSESTTSAGVGPIANINDAPTGIVSIDDLSPAQGDTLTASNTLADADGLSGSISYQWYRDGVAISGATATTYTTNQADVGMVITTVASYTDDQGTPETVASGATAAVTNVNDAVVGLPVILGTPTEDQILTADTSGISDADGLGTFSYRWYRDGVVIAGETATTYTLDDADVGSTTTLVVSYTDNQGTLESTTSAGVGPIANINDTPTGSVNIDDLTPAQGDTLTASNSLADADGLSGAISYQWYSDGVAISGATAAAYTVTQADVGSALTSIASYTDDQGTAEAVTSAATAAVTNVNDAVTGQPVILGTTTEDQVLTADTSGISDVDGLGTFSYQWYRDGVVIAGATATTYTLDDADVGSTTTLVVSYTDNQGTAESTTSAGVGPIDNVNDAPTGSVNIDNLSPAQGNTLTASNSLGDADGLSGAISYQWYRDGVAIGGATGSSYTTIQSDVGTAISAIASYTDDQGTAENVTSVATATVTNVNDAVTGQPVILGTPTEDQTLTADTTGISDVDGLGAFSYQWYRDGVAIAGATATTYTLGDTDVGSTTTLVVSYIDNQGTPESTTSAGVGPIANVNDAPTGAVNIDNLLPAQGNTLTASNSLSDADGLSGAISYQWYRDGVAISGATVTAYTTTQADVGSAITAIASYTDDQGTNEAITSAATAPVTNVNDVVTGQPVILGTPTEDQLLTADTTGINDVDGLGAFSYQWYRDGFAIAGATATTYTLGDSDVGSTTTLAVSYTDNQGTPESTTSAGLGPIANVNDTPTGSVLIDNVSPAQGELLTVSNTLADADGLSGAITYQWYRDGVAVTGATATTYTTIQADVGALMTAVASYTDDQGTAENVTSGATAAVTNVNDGVTGQPAILGTPTEDQVLSADTSSISDVDGLGAFSYQWYRDGVAINGATATTYTLGDADVGSTTTLVVSYTDNQGTPESTTSTGVGPITNINDAPTGLVTIDNPSPAQGDILTVANTLSDADGLSGAISYQWYRDGVAVSGASAATYTTTQADVGTSISAVASYTDDRGTSESVSSLNTAPVMNVNDLPQIPTGQTFSIAEDAPAGFALGSVTATDIDTTDTLSGWQITSGNSQGLFQIDAATGQLQLAPAGNLDYETTTSYLIGIQVSDGTGTSSTTEVLINVTDVNEAPVTTNDLIQTSEDRSVVINVATDLLSNDTDPEGSPLNLVSMSQPANGTLLDNLDGTWTYLPNADFNGQDSLTYIVSDGVNQRTANATVNVIAVNDAPVVSTPTLQQIQEDITSVAFISAVDVDDDTLSYELTGGNDAAMFQLDSSSGALNFINAPDFETPQDSNQDNSYNVEVTVADGQGGQTTSAIQIEIANQNEAPEIAAAQLWMSNTSETLVAGQLTATDPDANDSFAFQIIGGDSNDLFEIDANNGQIIASQSDLPIGLYELDVQVVDAGGLTSAARIQVVVATPDQMPGAIEIPVIDGGGSESLTPTGEGQTENNPNNEPTQPSNPPNDGLTQDSGELASDTSDDSTAAVDEATQPEPSSVFTSRLQLPEASQFAAQATPLDFNPLQLEITNSNEPTSQQAEGRQSLSMIIRVIFAQNNAEVNLNAFEDSNENGFDFSLPISPELAQALDNLAHAAQSDEEQIDLRVSGAVLGSVSLSAGFVVWMLRAGSLMASLVTSKPIWTDFDPLPVFVDDGSNADNEFFLKD